MQNILNISLLPQSNANVANSNLMIVYVTAVTSFFSFLIIHHIISPYVCRIYSKIYTQLHRNVRMEWDSRIASTVHSIGVTVMCFVALKYDTSLWNDQLNAVSTLSQLTICVSIGYMAADMVSMPFYWSGASLYIYIVHHFVALSAFHASAHYGVVQFFSIVRLTCELSTPFANLRWFFIKLNKGFDQPLTLLNTLVFAITFFLVRNANIPFYWVKTFTAYDAQLCAILSARVPFFYFLWIGGPLVLDGLNIYWSRKVYRGAYKAVKIFVRGVRHKNL